MNYRPISRNIWKKIWTTNLLEIKHRTKKVGAFTNDVSMLRLAISILIDINEDWITGNRYLSVKSEMISLNTGVLIYRNIETLPTMMVDLISIELLCF